MMFCTVKLLCCTIVLLLFFLKPVTVVCQNLSGDTANYPFWIAMMQDPAANFYKTQRAFNLYWKNREITRGCGWKVFKRWEYMMQGRVNPDGSLPAPDFLERALNVVKSMHSPSSGSWVSLGPSTIPAPGPAGYEGLGRLNTIAFHPADPGKMYVGAASGGFWMTADGGMTWTTTTDDLPSLGVSAIVVDYSAPDHIFIGTGDRDHGDAAGMGVYKSTDAGMTWNPSKTGMENLTVREMVQHPANPLLFLAATSGGVYRSVDGGGYWSRSIVGDFKDIRFKPGDPAIVYAAANAAFYRSTDNGVTFTHITAGLPSAQRGVIGVSQANPAFVYLLMSNNQSGYQGLYRSTDAGLTFLARSTSPNILDYTCDGSATGGQGWYDLALAVNPSNADELYTGGIDVWKSADGGVTWVINSHWWGYCGVPPVHADCHYLAFSPLNGTLYACNDGGLFGTSDHGATWPFFSETMTIGQIYKLGIARTVRDKVINGFQDNGTYIYTADGWLQAGGGDGMECAVDAIDAAYTFHTIYSGDIYRKYNNTGQSHIAGYGVNGITEYGAWVTPFLLCKSNHRHMFAGYDNVWRCNDVLSDTGITFEPISYNLGGSNSFTMTALEQSEANPNLLYAMRSDRKLFRTNNCLDVNPVWTDLSSSWPSALTGKSMAANPFNPDVLYMTAGTRVYKSTNQGAGWLDITGGLPSVSLNTVVCYKHVADALYLGTDAGVWYSDGTTGGWVPFNQGLPANALVTELEIWYDNDTATHDVIMASTYGRGLWRSAMYNNPPVSVGMATPAGMAIYPNPSHGLLTIESTISANPMNLEVITMDGREVSSTTLPATRQPSKITINLQNLGRGIYILRLTGDSFIKTSKLVLY
jgi:hypothetical protein